MISAVLCVTLDNHLIKADRVVFPTLNKIASEVITESKPLHFQVTRKSFSALRLCVNLNAKGEIVLFSSDLGVTSGEG